MKNPFIQFSLVSIATLGAFAALEIACGGNSGNGPAAGIQYPPPTPTATATGTLVLKTATGSHGEYMVDGMGKAVYVFMGDMMMGGMMGQSTCNGACATAWPPLTVTGGQMAMAEGNVQQSMISTSQRGDGSTQVTYNNWPLYYYSGDTAAGMINGEGLNQYGALWYLMGADGNPVH